MENSYIFISYAHADSKLVLPIINAMQAKGITVWYDNGIEAGSEWPEFIAQKIVNCTKFVSFISNAYINSQNCKRELNLAVSRNKELLSLYLEKVELPLGLELQLGTYQAVFRERFPSYEIFVNSVCNESFFQSCTIKTNTQNKGTSFDKGTIKKSGTTHFKQPYNGTRASQPKATTVSPPQATQNKPVYAKPQTNAQNKKVVSTKIRKLIFNALFAVSLFFFGSMLIILTDGFDVAVIPGLYLFATLAVLFKVMAHTPPKSKCILGKSKGIPTSIFIVICIFFAFSSFISIGFLQ